MAIVQGSLDTVLTEATIAAAGAIAATGTITFSSAVPAQAARATGTITVAVGNAANDDTVTVNGVEITFKTSGATGNQVNIGVDEDATAAALHAFLAASADASIDDATYSVTDNVVTVTHKTWGTAGNSFTLAKSGTNLAVSGATLSGGAAGDSITVNGAAFQFIPVSQTGAVTDIAVGASVNTTASLVAAALNASANTNVDDATYSATGSSGVVTVTHDTAGTAGNSFTLAKSGTNIAVSAGTLSGGAATGPIGELNTIGTSDGTILAARTDDTFEDNMLTLIGVLEFVVANVASASASDANRTLARQQKKFLKQLLQKLSSAIQPSVGVTDSRAAEAALVRAVGVAECNRATRAQL